MEVLALLENVEFIVRKAHLSIDIADPQGCITELAQLREFLNKQTELEARDKCESDEPSKNSAGPFDWIISGPPAGERSSKK